ncbi:hypothetical protein SLEP1_g40768 [Rubroshorea leprosula]|uniref:Uncharacterized protein n=1 Tax=Rubroshorea leprosula TaxID=152421 RepID=A0AAV5L5B8_9ROSI|nr:hypothetical protein SLEP1_g40768 [Rubroshorea leprosula]
MKQKDAHGVSVVNVKDPKRGKGKVASVKDLVWKRGEKEECG